MFDQTYHLICFSYNREYLSTEYFQQLSTRVNKESLFKVKLEPLNKTQIKYKTFIGHWFVKNKSPPTPTPLIHFHPFIKKSFRGPFPFQ